MLPLTKKKTQSNTVSGILLVDKPVGMTSHDVIDRVRRITGQRQVGHAGTLDPLASGLLVVCLGKATKVTKYLSGQEKSYRAVIRFGITSPTYDREGVDESAAPVDTSQVALDGIEAALESFRGTISQTVPAFSAVKISGQRLYAVARRGEEVELPSRDVTISSLSLVAFESPMLTLDITCSKGTYIRSLAHDIGQQLGCGAYLHELTRVAAGNLTLADALSLDEVESRWNAQQLRDDLHTIGDALTLPAITVAKEGEQAVANGRPVRDHLVIDVSEPFANGDTLVIKDDRGQVLAVGHALVDSGDLSRNTDDRLVFKYARVLI